MVNPKSALKKGGCSSSMKSLTKYSNVDIDEIWNNSKPSVHQKNNGSLRVPKDSKHSVKNSN